jgi:geranylgeranyl pyrophosphate synthase
VERETVTEHVVQELGFAEEVARVRHAIAARIAQCHDEVRPLLQWQFEGTSKYFRPLTVFSCHRAFHSDAVPRSVMRAAVVVEMLHNVSLIVDDILDASSQRRGRPTLHCQFGMLSGLMASGYIVADGFEMVADDPFDMVLFSELMKRLAAAECMQWRLRRQPLGVEDWLRIAGEDTGSMFEVCACLGTRNQVLRRFGHLVGVLYHGCDDVGDAKGLASLGGGGDDDLRDGILTLPAALAIRDPRIRAMFCNPDPREGELAEVARAMAAALPEAERYLDTIAHDAREEALAYAPNPAALLALVDHVRQLSRR